MLIINRIRVKNKNNKLKKFEIKSLILFFYSFLKVFSILF